MDEPKVVCMSASCEIDANVILEALKEEIENAINNQMCSSDPQ